MMNTESPIMDLILHELIKTLLIRPELSKTLNGLIDLRISTLMLGSAHQEHVHHCADCLAGRKCSRIKEIKNGLTAIEKLLSEFNGFPTDWLKDLQCPPTQM